MRYKVLINWYGEVLTFYTVTTSSDKALHNVLRQCSKRLGRTLKSVRDYVMDEGHQRWEVK